MLALEQAEIELAEDVISAEEMRSQHPHNMPTRVVGNSRESVLLEGETLKSFEKLARNEQSGADIGEVQLNG